MGRLVTGTLVGGAGETTRPTGLPAQFRDAVDRHQNNLIALSVALKAAGVTPTAAARYIDDALASFQNGLTAALAGQEEA